MAEGEGLQPRRRREPVLRQASPLEEIRLSCLKGNLQSVQRIIEAGVASVNEVFEDGWTALMVASNGAHPQIVQYILEQHGDPNVRRPDGFSPLMAALTSSQRVDGRVEAVVELLVKGGAEINTHNKAGLSPLVLAIRDNKTAILKLLILNGADVNSRDKDGRTPIFHAAERGFEEIVRVLLDNEADINIKDKGGRTAFEIAVLKGHNELADIIRPSSAVAYPSDENIKPELKLESEAELKLKTEPKIEPKAKQVESTNKEVPINQKPEAESKLKPEPKIEPKAKQVENTNKEVPINQKPEAVPVIHNSQPRDDPPAISNNLTKESVRSPKVNRADSPPAAQPVEKSSEKKGERKSFLAYGLAMGVGVGAIIVYYARVYYLKRY